MDKITKLKNFVTDARHIVVFTGAGISTASGIPDYRSRKYAGGTRAVVLCQVIGKRGSELINREGLKMLLTSFPYPQGINLRESSDLLS